MNIKELDDLRIAMIESKKTFNKEAVNFAEENCPHKIGEVIAVNSCSHFGKNIEITKFNIEYDNWKKEYTAIACGYVLTKAGTRSKQEACSYFKIGKVE